MSIPTPPDSIEAILDHVRQSVPFYDGGTLNLSSYPIVSKGLMLSRLGDFIAASSDRNALAEFLLGRNDDHRPEVAYNREIIVEQTSGSSGLPFRIPKTRAERTQASWGIWQHRKAIDPDATPRRFCAVIHQSPEGDLPPDLPRLLQWAEKAQIRWLHAGPLFLQRCLQYLVQRNTRLPEVIKYVENSGGAVDAQTLSLFVERTSATLIDQYGCREVWAMGYREGSGPFQLLQGNVVIELVNEEGAPVEKADQPGRVVVTSLYQKLLPFVRYDTGDIACWHEAGGRRGLVLSPHRSHHAILGERAALYGTDIFKGIMATVYRRVGYAPFAHLQIRQLATHEFALVVPSQALGEPLRAAVEYFFNLRRILSRPARFCLLVEDHELPEEKPCLFTNRYFKPSSGKEV